MKSFNDCKPGDVLVFEREERYVQIRVTKVVNSNWVDGIVIKSNGEDTCQIFDAVGQKWSGSFCKDSYKLLIKSDTYEIF